MNGPAPLRNVDAKLFVLAFLIAVTIKFGVHETEQLSERIVEAQVTYTPPGPEVVTYDQVDKVKVTVRGKTGDITRLAPFNVEVVANIPRGRTGSVVIQLDEEDTRFSINGDFEVLSIDPNRFTIQVEPRVRSVLPVHVVFSGEPSAGSIAGEPTVQPSSVQVTGPQSRVARIDHLVATISLDGHARDFEETVAVQSPDPLVQVARPNTVTVKIPMTEPELSIDFGNLDDGDGKAGSGNRGGS